MNLYLVHYEGEDWYVEAESYAWAVKLWADEYGEAGNKEEPEQVVCLQRGPFCAFQKGFCCED